MSEIEIEHLASAVAHRIVALGAAALQPDAADALAPNPVLDRLAKVVADRLSVSTATGIAVALERIYDKLPSDETHSSSRDITDEELTAIISRFASYADLVPGRDLPVESIEL
jgi:hypothetical protein